jgi:hypothetical protein
MEGAATVITTHGPAAILSRLRGALTSVGDALTLPDLESLVRAEADLASAVADLGRLPSAWSSKEGSEAITAEIAGVAGAALAPRSTASSMTCWKPTVAPEPTTGRVPGRRTRPRARSL